MRTFSSIQEFCVPTQICDESDQILRNAGLERNEHFVLWSGVIQQDQFFVKKLHDPCQSASHGASGLSVHVGRQALFELNQWLYTNQQCLAIQVHTHPTDAFHSDTDDRYPIVTTLGGLSLVVPDFGKHGVRDPATALYRLTGKGWLKLSTSEAARTLKTGK